MMATNPKAQKAEYMRRWWKANKHKKAEYAKQYYEEHKEQIADWSKQYYAANRDRIAKQHKSYYAANIEVLKPKMAAYGREYHKKRTYNLTEADYQQMLLQQQNTCPICRVSFEMRKPVIDHCHTTDKVRAILCDGCNRGLGYFKENPSAMRTAADYVESFRGNKP